MRYRLLGPLELTGDDGRVVALSGSERVLLATLVLGANQAVSTNRLVDALWGDDPPVTATNALQVHISKLRKKLSAAGAGESLASATQGYVLHTGPDEIDLHEFERLVSVATGDPSEIALRLREALALCRGPAMADVSSDLLAGEKARLEELQRFALERRIEADLAMGCHAEIIPELEAEVQVDPLREAPRRQLMLALYRSGRQADALATYRAARDVLAAELGIDPGPDLQDLELAILNQDPKLSGVASFEQLRSVDRTTFDNNLPIQLTSFVGRERELTQLRRQLHQSPLVTLTGPGGSGKTRLALQIAAELLDESENEVWFVDLAPLVDPDLVAESAATAIGVREEPGRPITATLIDALHERRLFLVLDNCEHLVGACAKLADAIVRSCPNVRVIATSREALGIDGEGVFRVPSLSLPPLDMGKLDRTRALQFEAIQLFADRAHSHNPDFALDDANAACVASVCGHLDGIPLAIELAAARLRSLSIADIEAHLEDRFHLLTGGNRSALPRQQTLRALIDWSYELLNSRDRSVFDRLAVFAGGFDLDAARAVCAGGDDEPFGVIDAIGSLVDKSLIQTDTTADTLRYRLLETIRQYARDRLGERSAELSFASARHAEVFLGLAEFGANNLHGAQQVEWLARLETEHDNLRAAMTYLLEDPDGSDEAIRLGIALREFWFRKGYHSEGVNLLRDAIDHPGTEEPTALRARGLSALAQMYIPSGDISPARACIAEGLRIAREVRDAARTAELLELSAWLDFQQGDYETASTVMNEAVTLARQAAEARLIASTLTHRGAITSSLDPDQARADFGESLSISRRVGDQERVINTLDGLALLELELGNIDEGRSYLEECVSLCRGLLRSETRNELLHALMNLGLATIMQEDLVKAINLWDEALRLCQDINSLRELPYNLLGVALCLTVGGEVDEAILLHGAASNLLEEISQSFEPLEETLRERDCRLLKQLVGTQRFEATYSDGRRFTSSKAIELAEQALRRLLDAEKRPTSPA